METVIKVEGVETKKSKNGKVYQSFKTNMGQIMCWDEKVSLDVIKQIGNNIIIDLEEKNGFKRITAYKGNSNNEIEVIQVGKPNPAPQPVATQTAVAQPSEPKLKLSIQQTSKGHAYWDISVRGDTIEEIKERLDQVIQLATDKCNELNANEQQEPLLNGPSH